MPAMPFALPHLLTIPNFLDNLPLFWICLHKIYITMKYIYALVLSWLGYYCNAQSVYTYTNELSCNWITDLEQDASGFIWIATEDGLNKFDGYTFTSYFHDEQDSTSLLCNYTNKLYLDTDHQLWIATNKGIQCYVPEKDAFYSVELPGATQSNVSSMAQLHDGSIWISTSGYGLYSINPQTKQALRLSWISEQCDDSYVNCIYEDRLHNVWISFLGNRLACISPEKQQVTTYTMPYAPFPKVYGMAEDDKNNLFILTFNDVLMKPEGSSDFISVRNPGNKTVVGRDIIKASSGELLISTFNQGIMRIDTQQIRLLPDRHTQNINMANKNITSLIEDADGNKWLACNEGLAMISNEKKLFEFWKHPDSDIQTSPSAVCQTRNGDLWIGNQDCSLFRLSYDKKIVSRLKLPKYPRSICEDETGNLWIGCNNGGLFRLNPQTEALHFIPDFGDKDISKIIKGPGQSLFIALPGNGLGYYSLSSGEARIITYQTPMKNNSYLGSDWINDLLADQDGLIWICHFLGVSCYDPKKEEFLSLDINKTLSRHVCRNIVEDKDGQLWIGTNNGIYICDKARKSLRHIGKEDGMPSNVICAMELDNEGDPWCSTYKGLCHIGQKSHKVDTYLSGNGLTDEDYTPGVSTKDRGGRIYFGGIYGITRFMPDSIRTSAPLHIPSLTGLLIDNAPANASMLKQRKNLADDALIKARRLTFSPTDNACSFEFSTFKFHNQKNIFFEYRLKGISDKWNRTALGENKISFNYLRPGHYTLEVRACEKETVSPVRSISLYVAPPWYLTPLAWAAYYLTAVSLIVFVIFVYFRRKDRRRKEEINEEKLRFFINIAHEIRSPLTLILDPLNELLKQNSGNSAVSQNLHIIKQNTTRIINLMNQLLDIRRIDKGQMNLAYKETDLVPFIKNICELFKYQADKHHLKLVFTHQTESLPAWIDPANFDKIIINLLTNAFKYTPDGGTIEIVLSSDTPHGSSEGYAEISIRDTGTGIKPRDIKRIFERFYQSSADSQPNSGFGIGLHLVKMLVELHHGTIRAENRSDCQGAVFTVSIPLGKGFLPADKTANATDGQYRHTLPDMPEKEPEAQNRQNKNAKRHILIAEDDLDMCKYLEDKLGNIYRVTVCHNGQEALQQALGRPFDLIVSDIVMPVMNGFELLRTVKGNTETNHIPVILLTSQAEAENRIKGWEEGTDAFLPKPFQIEELISLCNNLIEKHIVLKGKYGLGQDIEKNIKPIEVKPNDELFIERLTKVINEHLPDPEFTVEALAKEVGISRVQLHRKLKDMFGVSASEFIRNLRLKQATMLLKENKTNISQIAYAVGFSNPILFSSIFKKAYGCTPTEYRERNM